MWVVVTEEEGTCLFGPGPKELRSRRAGSEVIRWSLGSGVLPPDVKHEDRGNKQETHHKDWHRTAVTTMRH